MIRCGDCLTVMPTLGAFADAIVTDPPYHLTQASRKGSPRVNDPATPFGRTRLGGQDGGFMGQTWDGGDVAFRPETWALALGCVRPGSYLLAFGGTRTFHRLACAIEDAGWELQDCLSWLYGSGFPKHKSKLKPAWEPIILARRPAPKATPLQIDACRIGTDNTVRHCNAGTGDIEQWRTGKRASVNGSESGRWPANVVLDEDAAAMLDAQSGVSVGGAFSRSGTRLPRTHPVYGTPSTTRHSPDSYGDSGGASRFLYVAKASRAERGEGNDHPCVKPIALMRWLVRLITPPGGTVLDPFMGSGSTGCAAALEGREFIGIERSPRYCEIAEARIAHWGAQVPLALEATA